MGCEAACEQLLLKIGSFSFLHRFMSLEVQSNGTSCKQEGSSRQVKKNIAERKALVAIAVK